MRFPVPDSRRNGKSHIPGPAVFTRELSAKEKAGDLIVRLSCHSFGFAASAHKPAILSNRNIKTILYNLQVKTRSQRGRDRRLQPLTSLRSFCLAASSRCLAKVRKRPLGLDTLLGSSWRLGHSCKPDGSRLLRRLRDQKSKQKSRRECDSLFSTDVEPGNRTFPGLQPLPVLRYQCKKPGVFFKPTVFIGRIERPVGTLSGGVTRPCRSAAPLPTPARNGDNG